MRRRISIAAFAASLLIGDVGIAVGADLEPGGTPEATSQGLTNPDEFAWQLFLYLNRQARAGVAGEADPGKASTREYDPDKDVVWESWALSSGLDVIRSSTPIADQNHCTAGKLANGAFVNISNKSEVFKCPAVKPVPWENLDRGAAVAKVLTPELKTPAILSLRSNLLKAPAAAGPHLFIAPVGADPSRDESRMNKSTYETIRSIGLYSVEGLERLATQAAADGKGTLVTFEQMSKEVKARWVHLQDCDANPQCLDKSRYHWRTVTIGGQRQIWGLVSLHVITRDLPNWFWADFGHIDCEKSEGACGGAGLPASTPLRDSTTRSSGGVRKETAGTKWSFYRLRGTQTEFTTSDAIPTILSNPVVEATFQNSSCMTCHSYATVGLPAKASAVTTAVPNTGGKKSVRDAGAQIDIGAPDCRRFVAAASDDDSTLQGAKCIADFGQGTTDRIYVQTDFLWSIPFRAFSEAEQP